MITPQVTYLLLALLLALVGYAAFQQWIRHRRRLMIHRERLAAIEKGAELPALEHEIQRSSWNAERLLLFAGLLWVSVGVGAYLVLNALIGQPQPAFYVPWGYGPAGPVWVGVQVRYGMQWIGVALVGIGLSHLVVYAVGKNKER